VGIVVFPDKQIRFSFVINFNEILSSVIYEKLNSLHSLIKYKFCIGLFIIIHLWTRILAFSFWVHGRPLGPMG
jgi:hypothetical protein